MLWCCSLVECDKNGTFSSITNIFRSKRPSVTEEDSNSSPVGRQRQCEGSNSRSTTGRRLTGHTNPCLEDVTSTEEDDTRCTQHTDSTTISNGNTPSPEYYRSEPLTLDTRTSSDRHYYQPGSQTNRIYPNVDFDSYIRRLHPNDNTRRSLVTHSPEDTVPAVQSIVTASERRSWGKWWKSRRPTAPVYETFPQLSDRPSLQPKKEKSSSKKIKEPNTRSEGAGCVLVQPTRRRRRRCDATKDEDKRQLLDDFSVTPRRDRVRLQGTPLRLPDDRLVPSMDVTANSQSSPPQPSDLRLAVPTLQQRDADGFPFNTAQQRVIAPHHQLWQADGAGSLSSRQLPIASSDDDSPPRSSAARPVLARSHEQDMESPLEPFASGVLSQVVRASQLTLPMDEDPLRSPLDDSSTTTGSSPGDYNSIWRARTGGGLPRQSSLDSGGPDDVSGQLDQRPLTMWAGDSSTPSDDEERPGGVSYSDTTSLEQVNEDMAELLDTISSVATVTTQLPTTTSPTAGAASAASTPPKDCEKIKGQCVALWQLRSTLEDEGTDSDAIKTGTTPDEHSPDSDVVEQQTPPEGGVTSQSRLLQTAEDGLNQPLLSSEARRTSYRAILAQRLKYLEGSSQSQVSSENSFDSVETDNSSVAGDTNRQDIFNASVDSAFDGSLDHGLDSPVGRAHQMKKTDSGYRSIEVSTTSRYSTISWSQNTMDDNNISRQSSNVKIPLPQSSDNEEKSTEDDEMSSNKSPDDPPIDLTSEIPRKAILNQSRRMWHSICAEPSFMDTDVPSTSFQDDTNSKSSLSPQSTETAPQVSRKRREKEISTDETSGKRSVMVRFVSPHKYSLSQQRALQRDYSIDEKSDRLFREFSRTEPLYDMEYSSYTIPRRGRRNRRHARHIEVSDSSPRSHRRKLSPQDSIEEESPMDTHRDTSISRRLSTPPVNQDLQGWQPSPAVFTFRDNSQT